MKFSDKDGQSDIFDDNFEVTCDVDLSDIEEIYYNKSGYSKDGNGHSRRRIDDGYSADGEDIYEDAAAERDEFDDYEDYQDNRIGKRNDLGTFRKGNRNQKKKKCRRKVPNLVKPIQKSVQTGGKMVSKLLQVIARTATLVFIVAIMVVIGTRFWDTHSAYGNLNTVVAEKNYALVAYLGVGVLLLLFESIAFLWALTSEKIRDGRRNRRQDVGRGFTSFFLIYAGSYMALKFSNLLPESTTVLQALKAALVLYGSMNLTLLILGIAGMVSCIFRRFAYR